jgi:hypothetical protein
MAKRKPISEEHPRLLKEYNYEKNNINPSSITSSCGKKVWWKCLKGHEWQAKVCNRTRGRNCPYCSGKKACKDNCISTTHPNLIKEWHPTKNGETTTNDITKGSDKKYWWLCESNHSYLCSVSNKVLGRGCPYCSGQKIYKDKSNSLLITHPDIAQEWHPTKNGKLLPEHVTSGSSRNVWWMCNKKHVWKTSISSRANEGHGCQKCMGINYREEKSPRWNHKLSKKERIKCRRYFGYKQWRDKVFKRDKYTCKICNKKGCYLNAHHLMSFANNPELRLAVANGVSLCSDCHTLFHDKYGKGNNTTAQFKEFKKEKTEKLLSATLNYY